MTNVDKYCINGSQLAKMKSLDSFHVPVMKFVYIRLGKN